jgi:Ca2+-binding RTX toxin-like protein
MKKRLLTIVSLILIGTLIYQNGGLGFFDKKVAYAVGDLNVVWQSDPLFNYSNIAPGFEITKNVGVTNSAPSPRSVAIKGIKTSDTANMASVMHIEIKEGANVLYYDTLTNFFASSASPFGIFLSDLGNGGSTNYSVKVVFDESAGNQYQNKNIVFDLQIGITVGIPTQCTQISFPNSPIIGTSGNDKINGTSRNDLIITYEGNDKIEGGGGNDCIVSGEGNDNVEGGTGNDVLDLGIGNDKADGGTGSDLVLGGGNDDDLKGGSDIDQIYAGNGNDKVDGGSGIDTIYGEDGIDEINGGSDNDMILGGNGNDNMSGGSGNDNINGEADTDKAVGDSGTDTCVAEIKSKCEL